MGASPTSIFSRARACAARRRRVELATAIVLGLSVLHGCESQTGYDKAFSAKTSLGGNSHSFDATPDQTFKTVKITLVQQGFTIETADNANGLIKALRAFEDPKAKKISYLVTTSLDVTGAPSGNATIVTASASEQTVLHKDNEKYFHLLGLVPIPVGKNYQTIVRKEGNISDAAFYNDLFAAVAKNLPKAPAPVAVALPPNAPTAVATEAPTPTVGAPTETAPRPAATAPPSAADPVAAKGTATPSKPPGVGDMPNPFGTSQSPALSAPTAEHPQ